MASQSSLLKSVLSLIAGFDEGTWEALANKGLVRRARKDLESGISVEVEESGDLLRFKVPPYQVTMPSAGPAKASCTCPARGVCQHVLTAGMWLQTNVGLTRIGKESHQSDVVTPEKIEEEMLAITLEQLQQWAGVAAIREARQMATSGKRSGGTSGVVTIDFPDQGIQTRYTPGGGLDGIIVSGGTRNRQQTAAVAAVLFIHRANNRLEDEPVSTQQVLEEASEAPRSRAEVLLAAKVVLEEALEVGLSHASVSLKERLQTLAMAAQGTNLPRLSRMLRALTDQTEAIITRQGRASEAALFLAMARTYALAQALMQPDAKDRSDLIGVHRTRYQELNRLELVGAAAYPWQTPSGYLGLTVLYWDGQNKSWVSWSDARPAVQAAGFDPLKRFRASGPWEGTSSPEESASSKLVLTNPRRNPDGRLSSSASTKTMILGPVNPSEIDFGTRLFTSWKALRTHIAGVFPLGLRETHPLELIVVLQPHRFGPRVFDEQRQLFRWEIRDKEGATYLLAVPYTPLTKQTIKNLEEMDVPDDGSLRLVVKIISSEIGLVAEPLAVHRLNSANGIIVHLAFTENEKASASGSSAMKAIMDIFRGTDDDWTEDAEMEAQGPAYLEHVFGKIERELERAAESGSNSVDSLLVDAIKHEAERLGLTPLAKPLEALRRSSPDRTRAVLTLRYVCSLYRQSLFFN